MIEKTIQRGMVIQSTGSHCKVKTTDNKVVTCTIRGKFRINEKVRSTNPVAVGDEVEFTLSENSENGSVQKIIDRKNYILRKAILHNHKVHILCANIDQAVVIFTLRFPKTSTGFINRFLITAEAYHIPVVILFNKIDLLDSPELQAELKEMQDCYEKIGYKTLTMSALDLESREIVQEVFAEKISFISGHSGAGKSTILNLLQPNLHLKTHEISDYNDKGMHTTTFSEMYEVGDARIIDSPGIKEMGIADFDKQELSHYFPEMISRLEHCRFNNCLHHNEPNCAIKAAVESGEIHPSRYKSYLKILLDDLEE
ncbi:MAG: ribosome small subunit-dependent GTPase A [Bacteroidia bacterium]